MDSTEPVSIRPLGQADLEDAIRLLGALNPDTPARVVSERLQTILAAHPHYQLAGAFDGDALIGICGAWIATKIWCGRYLEIDNLVVDPGRRSSGTGTALIRHFEALARELDCKVITLDSYTSNHPSHRLYHRLGFEIRGFHFIKHAGDWSGKDDGRAWLAPSKPAVSHLRG
jgi:ribosomal protein S18 acetylase RimI-like enzyme